MNPVGFVETAIELPIELIIELVIELAIRMVTATYCWSPGHVAANHWGIALQRHLEAPWQKLENWKFSLNFGGSFKQTKYLSLHSNKNPNRSFLSEHLNKMHHKTMCIFCVRLRAVSDN